MKTTKRAKKRKRSVLTEALDKEINTILMDRLRNKIYEEFWRPTDPAKGEFRYWPPEVP